MPEKSGVNIAVIGSYAAALVMDVDRLPEKGETLLGCNFRQTYGGKGSDMAVQAARLGAQVEFIGVVGEDHFGGEFQSLMKSEGIGTSGIRIAAGHPTGAGFIIKSQDGHHIITVDMGANRDFCPADLDRSFPLIEKCQVMLIQLEIPVETAFYAARLGRELGRVTILNPAPAQDLLAFDLSSIDFLTPNQTEARVCLGLAPYDEISEAEIASSLLERGCRHVLITLGERGAHLFSREGNALVPAFKVDAIDTNGAGDSFNAALAVALGEGKKPKDAVRFANAAAALCCTKRETVPAYHDRRQLEDFLAQGQAERQVRP